MDGGEIRDLVVKLVESLKSDTRQLAVGDVMKRAFGPEGAFEGKMVEKSEVVKAVKEVLTGNSSLRL
jgi:hypothetical protein